MYTKLILLPILLSSINSATYNYNSTINDSLPVHYYSSTIPAGDRIISVTFQIKNIKYSNTFVFLSFSSIYFNLAPSDLSLFFQTNSPALSYMDVLSAIGGRPQQINVYIPANISMFYLTVFNLDNPQINISKTYSIQVNTNPSMYYCYNCPSGSDIIRDAGNLLSCQCSPCPDNYVGTTCSYFLQKLTTSITFSITNTLNKYYLIENNGANINLLVRQLTNTSRVYLYIQYQYTTKQIAGKLNSYYKDYTSFQYFITTSERSITIPSMGYNILLTFQNYGGNASTISIIYPSKQQTSSLLLIIVALTISILGFFIIIAIAIRIKNRCANRNSIQNVNIAVMNNDANLTDRQIHRFFPEVLASTIFCIDINSSISDVNINNEINEDQLVMQCSICFDNIKKNDSIRVTYCRHIFHAQCLLLWFHKNPSCPNCRQHFDVKTTKQYRKKYQKSVKAAPNQLLMAILGENFFQQYKRKGNNLEQSESKKQKQVQIQSKNLNIPIQSNPREIN